MLKLSKVLLVKLILSNSAHCVCLRKPWSSGGALGALGARSEGRGFDPRPMLDGSGVKAMPGSISAPNSGSL